MGPTVQCIFILIRLSVRLSQAVYFVGRTPLLHAVVLNFMTDGWFALS